MVSCRGGHAAGPVAALDLALYRLGECLRAGQVVARGLADEAELLVSGFGEGCVKLLCRYGAWREPFAPWWCLECHVNIVMRGCCE